MFLYAAAVVILASLFGHRAKAVNCTWNNTGTDFNTAGNWNGGVPTLSDSAVLTDAAVNQPSLSSSTTIKQLSFSTAAATGYLLTSANESQYKLNLTSTGAGTSSAIYSVAASGVNTIAAPIGLSSSGTQTFTQSAAGGSLVIKGTISNSEGNTLSLAVAGNSSITLSGDNSYTGTTNLTGVSTTAGTIGIGHDNAFSAGAVTISSGITLAASGGSRTIRNAVTMRADAIIGGSDDLTFTGSYTVFGANRTLTSNNTGTTTLSGNVYLSSDNLNVRGLTVAGTGAVVISGDIANSAGSPGKDNNLTFNSTGSLTLSGNNSYTGVTTLSKGAVILGNKAAFGGSKEVVFNGVTVSASRNFSGANAIANSGSLGATANIFTGVNDIEFSGPITNSRNSNAVTNHIFGGQLIFSGDVVLSDSARNARTLTFDGSGRTTISGVIGNGSMQPSHLVYAGTGTLVLANVNTFQGTTVIGSGTLTAGMHQTLGRTSGITIQGGGTLLLDGAGTNRVSDEAGLNLGRSGGEDAAFINSAGRSERFGALTLNATAAITLGEGAATLSFGGSSTYLGGSLAILDWTEGSDHVFFYASEAGTTPYLLSSAFLEHTTINGRAVRELASGEIVPTPVPEPATVVGGVLLLATGGLTYRRLIGAWIVNASRKRSRT